MRQNVNIRILNKIWKSNLLLAFIANFLFLLSILIFCDIKYEVSDDFVMAAIMSGAYGDAPNPHMIFINILWGYLMLPFYYLFPTVSWYLIFQLGLCFFALVLVSYMLLEKLNRSMAMMLIVILLTFFADDAYILVQFTKTAMLAVMGGGIVFAWALFEQKSLKVKIVSALVCLAGTLIRFNTIYIAGGFLLFIIIVEVVKILRLKTDRKKIMNQMMRAMVPGAAVIILAFGMKYFDSYVYNQNEEYRYFREYSKARAKIVDASDYGYEAYAAELQKIGVSENDYKLMRTWNFADNEVFSLDIMQKTGNIIAEYKKSIEISKEMILENMQSRGITGYPIFLACAIGVILTVVFQKKYYWTGFVASAIGFLYILYFFVIERTVYRTEYTVLLGVFLCLVYFWKYYEDEKNGENVECRRICVIISLVCAVIQLSLYIPDRSYQDVEVQGRKEYINNTFFESWNYDARKYRKIVNKGVKSVNLINEIESDRGNLYFLDFQTTMQTLYYEWNPVKALPAGYFSNAVYFASIMTNFPEYLKIFDDYDIEQPLKSLVRNNVYLIDTDSRTLNQKLLFLQEHYYPGARAELDREIDGYQIWRIYKK